MSSEETSGFGVDAFGDSEFGGVEGDETRIQEGYTGFGEGGFGEGGFGGFPVDAEFAGLFGSSAFGSEPFGGTWWVEVSEGPEPTPIDDHPDLREGVTPQGARTARARFEAHIKSAFNTGEGTQWDRLLNTFAQEFEDVHTARDEVVTSQYVDTATGKQLDKLGTLVQLPRRRDESDAHYRGRLKVQLRSQIGGGTIEDIKQVTSILLDVPPGLVEISEDFDIEAARFDIDIPAGALDDSPIEVDDFVGWLDKVRAGGVRVFGTIDGSFEHRSIEHYENDPTDEDFGEERGYGYGVYSGLLTN